MIQVINFFVDCLLIKLWSILLLSTHGSGKNERPARYS